MRMGFWWRLAIGLRAMACAETLGVAHEQALALRVSLRGLHARASTACKAALGEEALDVMASSASDITDVLYYVLYGQTQASLQTAREGGKTA